MTKPAAIARFGSFEVDLDSGELRKTGIRIRLPEQPFQILQLLLARPGELVTREELQHRLWSDNTFVDFDHGLNRAINKLREALCDSAEAPRYIETVPRRGYRFVMPVTRDAATVTTLPRSLAILPFTNAAGLNDADTVCDGIAESLIYQLAELPNLRVMARITAFRYRNSPLDAQTIGRELNVDAVLTGRVRLRGESLVVEAELVDVRDGSLLWGQQYNRQLADLFAVQEEMSRAIFERLRLTLTERQLERVQKRQTSSLEAHQLYLRGVFSWSKRDQASVRRAVEYFKQAQAVDPGYALAHAGLADCFAVLSIFPYCYLPPSEAMPRAKAAALRALELDPDLAEAHSTLGLVHLCYEYDFAGSAIHFQRALELKPSYSTAHLWHCLYCIAVGDLEQARQEAQRTAELDPLSPIGCSLPAVATYYSREFEPAAALLSPVAMLEPSYAMLHLFRGYAECALHRPERAIVSFEQALELTSGERTNSVALSRLGYAYGLAGNEEKARAILRQLDEQGKTLYVPAHAFVFVYMGLGELDAALSGVEQMVLDRNDYVIYLREHAAFDVLRKEPRFIAAMQPLQTPNRATAATR
jgi:TolB-like protein/Flp pilus assembly protein TadD